MLSYLGYRESSFQSLVLASGQEQVLTINNIPCVRNSIFSKLQHLFIPNIFSRTTLVPEAGKYSVWKRTEQTMRGLTKAVQFALYLYGALTLEYSAFNSLTYDLAQEGQVL